MFNQGIFLFYQVIPLLSESGLGSASDGESTSCEEPGGGSCPDDATFSTEFAETTDISSNIAAQFGYYQKLTDETCNTYKPILDSFIVQRKFRCAVACLRNSLCQAFYLQSDASSGLYECRIMGEGERGLGTTLTLKAGSCLQFVSVQCRGNKPNFIKMNFM